MKNEYMRPATELSLPVPEGTVSGSPVKVGALNGVAATNRGEGGNAPTHATVVTDARLYLIQVQGTIPGPGTPVYVRATGGLTTEQPAEPNDGVWGYTIPKVGESGVRNEPGGVAVVRPAQV